MCFRRYCLSSLQPCVGLQFGVGPQVQMRFHNARPTFQEIAQALKVMDARLDMEPKALKKTYMSLVKKHHPDKPGGCAEKMKQITTAYDCLKTLSSSERSAFQNQFSGGGPRTSQTSRGPASAHYRQPGAGGGFEQTGRAAYDWQRMYQEQQRQRDFSYSYSRGYHKTPFNEGSPFRTATGATRWKLLQTPLRTIVIRIGLAYILITGVMLVFFRRYRDVMHDDGWRSSESLSRKDQMEDMYRVRQEIVERLGNNPRFQHMMKQRQQEREMYEYASVRARENAILQRSGFESFHPAFGTLHRNADDPEGMVYFEPRDEETPVVVSGAYVPPHLSSGQEDAARLPGTGVTSSPAYTSHYTDSARRDREHQREEAMGVQYLKMQERNQAVGPFSRDDGMPSGLVGPQQDEPDFRGRAKVVLGNAPTAATFSHTH